MNFNFGERGGGGGGSSAGSRGGRDREGCRQGGRCVAAAEGEVAALLGRQRPLARLLRSQGRLGYSSRYSCFHRGAVVAGTVRPYEYVYSSSWAPVLEYILYYTCLIIQSG